MKKSITLLIIFLLVINIFAKTVSHKQLLTISQNWISHVGEKHFSLSSWGELPTNYDKTIYYFNFEPNGFVIMSSNDQTEPILAYKTNAQINPERIPPAALQLLNHFSEQIEFIHENDLQYPEKQQLWNQLEESDFSFYDVKSRDVSPLVTSAWDQGSPYNMYCPTQYGQHTLVGCVATAMGQIMRFHQHPEHGIGSNSYTWNGQTVSADFASTYYDWSNMPNSVYNGSPLAQRQAVATLLFHCGVGVEMEYGLDGSGANSEYAKYALQYYFNYSPTIQVLNKDSYQIENFVQILIENLEASQPMYYAGHDGNMGHAFVCDGFQGSNYFHFNWGWSGSYDGYFYLHDLTPGYNNFNYGQQAIVHIKKPVAAFPPQNLTALPMGSDVMLMWEIPEETNSLTGYHVYRNNEEIDFLVGEESTSYFDIGLETGEYEYYITSQYYETEYVQPESEPSNIVIVNIGTDNTEDVINLQNDMILQNYPNPFNPQTTIRFYSESLEQNQPVTIEIFNVKGQQIKQINIKNEIGKMNEILWNGSDNTGKPVPSGIYFYKLNIINSPVNKMIFLK
jgi:hypothetical protein